MKRHPPIAAAAALVLSLAACNDPSTIDQPKSASSAPMQATTPAPPAAPPPQAESKRESSPQAQLDADMQLSNKVKDAVEVPARSHIEVAANDGVVTLYGTVDAPTDKDRIARVAMGVEGVRSVVNNLVVLKGS